MNVVKSLRAAREVPLSCTTKTHTSSHRSHEATLVGMNRWPVASRIRRSMLKAPFLQSRQPHEWTARSTFSPTVTLEAQNIDCLILCLLYRLNKSGLKNEGYLMAITN